MNPSVCILYGLFEGPRHGARLRLALEDHGYRLLGEPDKADYIIAHSGGLLELTNPSDGQKILLIDPPYRPDTPVLLCLLSHIRFDLRYLLTSPDGVGYWAWKTSWNLWYGVAQPRRQLQLYRRYKQINTYPLINRQQTTVVQSDDCSWFNPIRLPPSTRSRIRRLGAAHDDCWYHPEPYIALLSSLAK